MSEQPKHTPGDWHAEYSAEVVGYAEWLVIIDGCKYAIAQDILDPETGQPSKANAHLIAAAPELLEALRNLIQQAGRHGCEGVFWDEARAAIAKAEGRAE